MSSSFKVLVSKDINTVLMKGNFNEFQTYNDLKNKLIEKSQQTNFKDKDYDLKKNEHFILIFNKEIDNNTFFPDGLEGFWDNKTYSYFKEKLILRRINNGNYKLYVQKVKKLPKWKRKENHEFLNEALDESWKAISEDIIKGLNSIKLEHGKENYLNIRDEIKKNEEKFKEQIHTNIVCNNCFKKDIVGKRFICAECNNYNLCQDCEKLFYKKQIHQREHTLIQINTPLNEEKVNNLFKYNNIIDNNNQEFKNVFSAVQIEFTVINNGENDLKNCYILPVRFGSEYLNCNPKIITNEVQRNMPFKMNLVVKIPDENTKGYYEGYFRMFTPNGLPFGKVIYVKVLNGD